MQLQINILNNITNINDKNTVYVVNNGDEEQIHN